MFPVFNKNEPIELEKLHGGYFIKLHEASHPQRPALILIPGFLTETKAGQPFEGWSEQIKRVALKEDMAAYGLHWPSHSIRKALQSQLLEQLKLELVGKGLPILALLRLPFFNLFYLATTLGWKINAMKVARADWKQALEYADHLGKNPHLWLSSINRPRILIGHSLGGRIALKAAMSTRKNELLRVCACAPAIFSKECSFELIKQNVKHKSAVLYSNSDAVLKYVFPIAELSNRQVLGYHGVPKRMNRTVQAVDLSSEEYGHNDYRDNLFKLMTAGNMSHFFRI